MNWYGEIAFNNQVETEPGIYENKPVKRYYYGDLTRDSKRDQLQGINPDIVLVNQLTIVADPYLQNSFHDILYVTLNKTKWRVSSVEETYPTITLHFGQLYKEEDNED